MRHRYDKSKRKRSYTKTVTKMIGSEIVEGIETGVVLRSELDCNQEDVLWVDITKTLDGDAE